MFLCRKFYYTLSIIGIGRVNEKKWFSIICDTVKFYEGGLSYEYAIKMPLSELLAMQEEAVKINREIEKASKTK